MQSTATSSEYDVCDKVSFIICFAQMLIFSFKQYFFLFNIVTETALGGWLTIVGCWCINLSQSDIKNKHFQEQLHRSGVAVCI